MSSSLNVRMNRKKVLEPIANSLGIKCKQFKNKTLLIAEIERLKISPPSARCYNQVDPCTMESIDEIEEDYFVEWNQYGHHFGADARSLKKLIDEHQNYILPWSIDFSTGIQASIDHELYLEHFDMRKVNGLMEQIHEKTSRINTTQEEDQEEVPFDTLFLFEMDKLLGGDGYSYGVIINKILTKTNTRDVYKIISRHMYRLLYQLQDIHQDVFYQYCYLLYSTNAFHILDRKHHLLYMLQVFKQFEDIIGSDSKTILQLLFIDM